MYRVWSFMYFVRPEEIPGTATITEARMHMVGTESTKIATDRFEIYVQSSCGPGVMDSPDKRPSVDGGSTLLLSEKQMWPETGILVWQLSKANVSPDFAWVVQKLLSGCAGLKAGSAIAVFITGTESFADGTYVGSQDYGVPAEAPELRLSVAIP